MDLFSYEPSPQYPDIPGFKARETSEAAAHDQAPRAPRLRLLVLTSLKTRGPATADEVAQRLGIDKLSIRPRLSELSALGSVKDSGDRRPNASGKQAVVWCAA